MKEVKYYISDDETFRADNPEEVIKYEEETEKQLKEELQKLSEFYAAEEVGYVAIVNHGIGITYFGPSKPSILEEIKNRLSAATLSGAYGYVVCEVDTLKYKGFYGGPQYYAQIAFNLNGKKCYKQFQFFILPENVKTITITGIA